MILKMISHAGATLGATVALALLLNMTADEFITIWLAFASVACAVEYFRDAAPQPSRGNVLDLFERIDQ